MKFVDPLDVKVNGKFAKLCAEADNAANAANSDRVVFFMLATLLPSPAISQGKNNVLQ